MSFATIRNIALGAALTVTASLAHADEPTPGYPEKIIQWGVMPGETCVDIARAMYGGAQHSGLLLRYNRIACTPGAPLKPGMTLVLPATVTTVPTARITSVNPETRARPAGGGWAEAHSGQPLSTHSNVNTLEDGRASIQFIDRSKVYMAEHTLVVIFGTASQTQVSKTRPLVEVQSGELRAGLAALRGDAVNVAVKGGALVSAASNDTVIRKREKRTTVAVFDGNARVRSAGKDVAVPKHFGSAFVEAKPPSPPRPLPPAPVWADGSGPKITFGAGGKGRVELGWNAVPKAVSYRLELSRDAAFEELVLREEMPASVRKFRAESLGAGDYFVRVRAIDNEDFLGIASQGRPLSVLDANWGGLGTVDGDSLVVSPYAMLSLQPSPSVELAFDDGAFNAMPPRIDFAEQAPTRLRWRRKGQPAEIAMAVSYARPKVTLDVMQSEQHLSVRAAFAQLHGVDVMSAIKPRAVLRGSAPAAGSDALLSAIDDMFGAELPHRRDAVAVDLVDGRGALLASYALADEVEPEAAPEREVWIGPTLGLRPVTPRIDVAAWSPTPRSAAALTGVADSADGDGPRYQGEAYALGGIGPLGIEALVRGRASEDRGDVDSGAWLGARYRIVQLDGFELANGLRVSIPLDDMSPPVQLEPSVALGGVFGDFSWLANLGARIRLQDLEQRTYVDDAQGFAILGAGYDIVSWWRAIALLDGHVLAGGDPLFRGGLSLGMELGTIPFVSIAGRVSPWRDVGGHVSGHLGVGFRSF